MKMVINNEEKKVYSWLRVGDEFHLFDQDDNEILVVDATKIKYFVNGERKSLPFGVVLEYHDRIGSICEVIEAMGNYSFHFTRQ